MFPDLSSLSIQGIVQPAMSAQPNSMTSQWQRNGMLNTMKTTIDQAGRIVIPKAIRESVGLAGGSEVEIREVDGRIEIEPVATDFRIVIKGGIPVAVADRQLPVLTDEIVRDTLEKVRDERIRPLIDEVRRSQGKRRDRR